MLEKNNNPEPEEEDEQELLYELCEYCGKKEFRTRMLRLTFWNRKDKEVWRCNRCKIDMQDFVKNKSV
jgi:hypothetical protein